MKNALLSITLLIAVCSSCTKDRSFPVPMVGTGPGNRNDIQHGTLVINEFEARGSTFYNELVFPGNPEGGSDWFEIYNTTDDTIEIVEGKWFVTDSLVDPQKYALPALKINPRDFLVIWCDTMDSVMTQIHANFSLTKSGEDLGIFFKQANDSLLNVDSYIFGSQLSGVSFGREVDGSVSWTFFTSPTPGSSNEQ